MKRSIRNILLAASATVAFAACTEINDYPDGSVEFSEVFQSEKLTAGWLNNCYAPMVNATFGSAYGKNHSFLDAATDNAHDVDDVEGGPMAQWNSGLATISNNPLTGLDKWESYYAGICNCNIFINNIDDAYILEEGNRQRYRAEAHGLRAYYYLQLIKIYGGVPLILDQKDDSDYDYSTVRPATYSEVVRQILADCQVVLDCEFVDWRSGTSDTDLNRINKAIASAIMSEAALYAASPLNNDGTLDWEEAAEICKAALDGCTGAGYKLFTNKPSAGGNENLICWSAYDLFFMKKPDTAGNNEKESILSISQCNVWQYNTAPIASAHIRAGSCPSQELIDCYETTDGKQPILGYADAEHLQPIINPDAKLYDETKPYENRDPRLKSTIYFNGAHAHLQNDRPMPCIWTGEGSRYNLSATNILYSRTGYYLHKYFNITSSRSSLVDGYYRVFRLAELYLNYAEAANEAVADGANAPTLAINAVNEVRSRVGMPKLPSSMTKEDFRARVRNERRVEFAFEDHRFFDVRRWDILEETSVVTGMRPVGETITKVKFDMDKLDYARDEDGNLIPDEESIVEYRTNEGYERFSVGNHSATGKKFLRLPVPGKEATALEMATGIRFQNPGW